MELLHHQKNQLAYRKRTEIAVEIVRQIEAEGQFANADYAFDNGVLTLELTQLIEASGKHWVSEIECSRLILWNGQWCRVDGVATQLRSEHPESFRRLQVRCRNGKVKLFWAFTKTVRLKRYGRKRLVIVHEQEDLSDTPRFLLTDAKQLGKRTGDSKSGVTVGLAKSFMSFANKWQALSRLRYVTRKRSNATSA